MPALDLLRVLSVHYDTMHMHDIDCCIYSRAISHFGPYISDLDLDT